MMPSAFSEHSFSKDATNVGIPPDGHSWPSVQILSDKSEVPSGQKYPGTHGRQSVCVKLDLNEPGSQIEQARSFSNRNPSKATGPYPRSHAIGRGEPSGQKNGKSHLEWFS